MNRSSSSAFLSFLLLFSISLTALPQIGYAQAASQTAAVADYSKALQTIEEKTDARRKELGIPGISLVIVKDDKIIYAKGLGYKDYESKVAVTPDTQFAIGSATKAFTALSVLMAADEGKLSLEDSPKKYLPYFKMYDPDTDKNITIRDLMCHSSGLNRTDLAMVTGKLNRAELIQVAAQAKPTAKLREKFQYQNIMFTAAGEIASVVEKTPYDKLIIDRVFKPLGMANSTVSMKQMQKAKDFSFGYNYNFDTKETARLPFRDIDEIAPAGSINSSANDMAQWLRFVLNGGSVNGKRLVSEKSYEEWLKPQMKIAGTSSYGFGWFLQDWNGLKVVQHGGNIDGFNSMVAMIPEKHLGFVLLTNVSASSLGTDLMPIVWENILGDGKVDENIQLPFRTMERLIGKYHLDEANINVEVKIDGNKLVMIVPGQPQYTLKRTAPRQFIPIGAPNGFAVAFEPAIDDAKQLILTQPDESKAILNRVNADGTIAKPAETQPAANTSAKDLVGKYATPAGVTAVEIRESDGKVTFNIGGQQPYTLADKGEGKFSMAPLPDTYWLVPKLGPDGKISAVAVTQPEGVFEFKRVTAESAPKMTADELMQRAIEAAGGEANMRKVTTRVMEFDMDLESQGVQAHGTSYAKAPNRYAGETIFTALGKTIGTEWEFFDGTRGEDALSFAPTDKYSGKRLEDIRIGSDLYAMLNWKTAFKKVEVIGTAKIAGEDAWIVLFESEKGTPYREYYSTKTFLALRRDGLIASSTSEQQIPYQVTFTDYRDVDGLKLPFKTVNNNIANGNIVTTIKSVKHNVPVDDSVFGPKKVK